MNHMAYRKECKLRPVGMGGFEITIPKLIVDRAARQEGMTTEEFAKSHKVVHLFNDFTDFNAAYRFEKDEPTEKIVNVGVNPKVPEKGSFDDLRQRIRR